MKKLLYLLSFFTLSIASAQDDSMCDNSDLYFKLPLLEVVELCNEEMRPRATRKQKRNISELVNCSLPFIADRMRTPPPIDEELQWTCVHNSAQETCTNVHQCTSTHKPGFPALPPSPYNKCKTICVHYNGENDYECSTTHH